MYRSFGKRILDVVLSVAALILLAPVFAGLALLVRIRIGSPVIFRQERLGLNGRTFSIIKFRTMTDEREHGGRLLPDSVRLRRFGSLLRATSLDELPEVINVLKGEMSIVGPRPLYAHYRDRYSVEQFRRHESRPGITGWAQVNGRNSLSWSDKFKLDVWYVDHLSFGLDLKILSMTLLKTILRHGINQPGQATAEEFRGGLQR